MSVVPPVDAMLVEGSQAFCLVKSDSGPNREVAGICVESLAGECVIAAPATSLVGVSTAVTSGDLAFVKVPSSGVTDNFPPGWNSDLMKTMPAARKARAAWFARDPDIDSSEVEVHLGKRMGRKGERATGSQKMPADMQANLSSLQSLLKDPNSDDEDEEESDDDTEKSSRFAPPGGKSAKKVSKKSRRGQQDVDFSKLAMQQLVASGGGQPMDLTTVLLLKMLQDKEGQGRRSRKKSGRRSPSSSGGSGSDSEDRDAGGGRGLKAIRSLHKMHDRVLYYPKKIVKDFEKEVIEELGVCPGQSWTMLDWVKRQNFGKFKGLFRCCAMDVAVYEMLRNKEYESATAQIVQNLKAKHQAVLQQGEWTTAWLLTGLHDPVSKREFAGTKSEMAAVSGYVSALAKLKKQVKEAESWGHHEEDEKEKK